MEECPNCGAKVNATDKRCSKCDKKKKNQKMPSSKIIISVIIVVVIIAILGAFASGVFNGNDSSVQSADSANHDGQESTGSVYWGSTQTDKFHLPDCEWAEKISEDNKIVYHSREEAISDGKEPCGVCNP